MTKKEARLTLQENFGYLSQEHPRILEALRVALDALSQPSLPSNLYGAAFNYAKLCKYEGVDKLLCAEHFKAGAEWMAEQGVCADAAVCKLTNRAWITPLNENQFEEDVFDNFVADDKVIVQIRKKEE